MTSLLRSFFALLPAALLVDFAVSAQETRTENVFTKIEKATDKAVFEASFQMREKLDFTADARTRAAIEQTNELRLLRAAAAGKFVNEHFTNKIVVPVIFLFQDDPLGERELDVFLDQAISVKMAGPVYIIPSDGALFPPDERPTAAQLNDALNRSIELRADAIVIFMGLPDKEKEKRKLICRQWGEDQPRLIFTELTDSFFLKRSMFPCPVAAAILPRPFPLKPEERPWYDSLFFWKDAPPAPDPFDRHYILLADENADELIEKEIVFLTADKKEVVDLFRMPWLNWTEEAEGQESFQRWASRRKTRKPSVMLPDDLARAYRELFRRDTPDLIKIMQPVEETK